MHLFTKPSSTSSSSSSVTCDAQIQSKRHTLRTLSFALMGTASLGLLLGLSILGLAANTLRIYDDTNLGPQYFLPLWPRDTDLKPTIGYIVAGSLAVVGNVFVVGFGRANFRPSTSRTAISLLPPLLALSGILTALGLHYASLPSVNRPDTIVSWACRWNDVPMKVQPKWGEICRQGRSASYVALVTLPVEVVVLGLVWIVEKVRSDVWEVENREKGEQ